MILVDANIWSLAFRRKLEALSDEERRQRARLEALILSAQVAIVHVVRQEVLTGLRSATQFAAVRDRLREIPDVSVTRDDYERAAESANRCASRGVATSGVDMLLCAVAAANDARIWTNDRDFERYADVIADIALVQF